MCSFLEREETEEDFELRSKDDKVKNKGKEKKIVFRDPIFSPLNLVNHNNKILRWITSIL